MSRRQLTKFLIRFSTWRFPPIALYAPDIFPCCCSAPIEWVEAKAPWLISFSPQQLLRQSYLCISVCLNNPPVRSKFYLELGLIRCWYSFSLVLSTGTWDLCWFTNREKALKDPWCKVLRSWPLGCVLYQKYQINCDDSSFATPIRMENEAKNVYVCTS